MDKLAVLSSLLASALANPTGRPRDARSANTLLTPVKVGLASSSSSTEDSTSVGCIIRAYSGDYCTGDQFAHEYAPVLGACSSCADFSGARSFHIEGDCGNSGWGSVAVYTSEVAGCQGTPTLAYFGGPNQACVRVGDKWASGFPCFKQPGTNKAPPAA